MPNRIQRALEAQIWKNIGKKKPKTNWGARRQLPSVTRSTSASRGPFWSLFQGQGDLRIGHAASGGASAPEPLRALAFSQSHTDSRQNPFFHQFFFSSFVKPMFFSQKYWV